MSKENRKWNEPVKYVKKINNKLPVKELAEFISEDEEFRTLQNSRKNENIFEESGKDTWFLDNWLDRMNIPENDKLRAGCVINELVCRYMHCIIDQAEFIDFLIEKIGSNKYDDLYNEYEKKTQHDREEDKKIVEEIEENPQLDVSITIKHE